jgi:hypothetical protein
MIGPEKFIYDAPGGKQGHPKYRAGAQVALDDLA